MRNEMGLSEIAGAVLESSSRKEATKNAQLHFSVINPLPKSEEKSKLLLGLLHSTGKSVHDVAHSFDSGTASRVSIDLPLDSK